MENKIILLDTSILIEYYRKKNKTKSSLFQLSQIYSSFAISAVSHFEIYSGANSDQLDFWNNFFSEVTILPFTAEASALAVRIDESLKKKRKQIAIPDLFIAATAIAHNIPIATLNKKHFERVDNLEIIG